NISRRRTGTRGGHNRGTESTLPVRGRQLALLHLQLTWPGPALKMLRPVAVEASGRRAARMPPRRPGMRPILLRSHGGDERVTALRAAFGRFKRLYDLRLVCPPEGPAGKAVVRCRADKLGDCPV